MPEAQPATIAAAQLSALTGFSVAELSSLSRKGYFPKPNKDGHYEQAKALVGCFKAYKDKLQEAGALPVYQSMSECSAQASIPRSVLKTARKESPESFRSHRILLGPLLKWIFTRDPEISTDWLERNKRADALLKEHKLETEKQVVVPRNEVRSALIKGMALVFGAMERDFTVQLPPTLKGLDERAIQQRMLTSVETFKTTLRTEFEKFTIETKEATEQ